MTKMVIGIVIIMAIMVTGTMVAGRTITAREWTDVVLIS
jgi:hypothetical protein